MSVFPIGSGGNTPHPIDNTHLSRGVLDFLDLAAGGPTSLGGGAIKLALQPLLE